MPLMEGLLMVIEVRCPRHGTIYDLAMVPEMPLLDAHKLRDATIRATCYQCKRDGIASPHSDLLWATEPVKP